MSGCFRFPVELDSGLTVVAGSIPECPIDVESLRNWEDIVLTLSVNFIVGNGSNMLRHHIDNFVIPYMNRIWKPAGVQFTTRRAVHVQERENVSPTERVDERNFDRYALRDTGAHFNIFVVPFISSGLAGYASLRSTPGYMDRDAYIVMAENRQDGEPWNLGRFANTLAHEVGHILGLMHVTERGNLMYESNAHDDDPIAGQEERLTPLHIEVARMYARRGLVSWNFHRRAEGGVRTLVS